MDAAYLPLKGGGRPGSQAGGAGWGSDPSLQTSLDPHPTVSLRSPVDLPLSGSLSGGGIRVRRTIHPNTVAPRSRRRCKNPITAVRIFSFNLSHRAGLAMIEAR